MKDFITHVEKFSEESRPVSKLVWIWLEGAERGDFLRVYGVWDGCVGVGSSVPCMDRLCILWTSHGHQRSEQLGFLINFPRCGTQRAKKWWGLKAVIKYQKMEPDPLCYTYIFRSFPLVVGTPTVPQPWKDLQFTDPTTFFLALVSPYLLSPHLKTPWWIIIPLHLWVPLCLCSCSYFLGKS